MRYLRPTELDQALAEIADGALPLAGGSVLVPLIARGALTPSSIVDVSRLPQLNEVRDDDGELTVGAAVTLTALAGLRPAGEAALSEAAAAVGNPLVRRIGTVGGNVGSRLPQADLAPALLVLDASVVWAGPGDERASVADVLAGAAGSGRLVGAVRIGRDPTRRSGFVKFAWREATGAAVASVAFAAARADGAVAEPRLAVGGLVAPCRLPTAEAVLAGRPWSEATIEEAAAAAAEEASTRAELEDPDDIRPRLVALGVRRLLHRLGAP